MMMPCWWKLLCLLSLSLNPNMLKLMSSPFSVTSNMFSNFNKTSLMVYLDIEPKFSKSAHSKNSYNYSYEMSLPILIDNPYQC
jgi:hypothetical protein